jgi:hypothetical protein
MLQRLPQGTRAQWADALDAFQFFASYIPTQGRAAELLPYRIG